MTNQTTVNFLQHVMYLKTAQVTMQYCLNKRENV